jgi:acetyl esterase/lipase
MTWKLFALLGAGTILAQAGTPEAAKRHGLILERDIVYKTVGGTNLLLDFLPPQHPGGKPSPLMIYIHGGGWANGDRYAIFRQDHVELLKQMNQAGIACATIEYRLTRSGTTVFEAAVDCKDAARFFVKEAARFNIDPQRIGTWGGSAGGHLSLETALAPNRKLAGDEALRAFDPTFRCAVAYYPLTSFLTPDLSGGNFKRAERLVPILGGPLEEKRELAELLSPVSHLTAHSPPVLLIHGDQDQILSHEGCLYMQKRAQGCGASVEVLIVKGAAHGLRGENITPPLAEVTRQAMTFVRKALLETKVPGESAAHTRSAR